MRFVTHNTQDLEGYVGEDVGVLATANPWAAPRHFETKHAHTQLYHDNARHLK